MFLNFRMKLKLSAGHQPYGKIWKYYISKHNWSPHLLILHPSLRYLFVRLILLALLDVNYSFCDILNWSFCHFRLWGTPPNLDMEVEVVVKSPNMVQDPNLRVLDPTRRLRSVPGRCPPPPPVVRNTNYLRLCSGSRVIQPHLDPPSCRWCPCTATTTWWRRPRWWPISLPWPGLSDHHTIRAGSWHHQPPVTRTPSPCLQCPPWPSTPESWKG